MQPLEAQGLTCSYDQHVVLRDLELSFHAGEILVLIGPNGAGKTTLLRALARLMRPQTGTVLLAGQDAWQLSPGTVARRLAMASQQENVHWPVTVEQAVALGRAPHRGWLLPYSRQDRHIIEQALSQTGLQALRHRLMTTLSGGEQRRVILARALAQQPQVLLLDEPTAHLDLKYQAEVLDLVQRLAHEEGLTIAIALHDLNQAALCAHRIALLADGSLVALGRPDDVLTPDRLAQAYGVEVVVVPHPIYGTPMVAPRLDRQKETKAENA
ncbi:MAG: ABC transporter ATP-binding protein [Candidatus Tectomicrobia bacterium]